MTNDQFIEYLSQLNLNLPQDELDRLVISACANSHIPYHEEMVALCVRKKSFPLLKALIAHFGVHARDPRSHEHLIQSLVYFAWEEALEYVLKKEPSLINVGCPKENGNHDMVSLIWYAIRTRASSKIIKLLLTYKPNLALKDSDGNNIFHDLHKESLDPGIQQMLINMAEAEVFHARNNFLETPYECVKSENHEQLCEQYLRKDPSLRDNSLSSIFRKEGAERIAELARHFEPAFPNGEWMIFYWFLQANWPNIQTVLLRPSFL